jgi:centromere/kinetochore protein ZW10
LDVTEGFIYTNDQDGFDTCEEAVNAVVKKVKRVWQVWKVSKQPLDSDLVHNHDIDHLRQGILPHSRHLTAVGKIVDAVLSRILEDITKLPDITADESHRLSELCRMFNALEGLFVEGSEQVSSRFFLAYQAATDVA